MLVTIKGKEYKFEFEGVWGPLYTYEELFGEKLPFNAARTLCVHLMFYCILMRCNKDFDLTCEDFVEALNDMRLEHDMRFYYLKRMEILTAGLSEEKPEEDKKKD